MESRRCDLCQRENPSGGLELDLFIRDAVTHEPASVCRDYRTCGNVRRLRRRLERKKHAKSD